MSSPKEGDLGIIKPPSTTSTLAKSITTTNDLMPIISHDAAAGRWGEPVDSEEGPVSLNEAINEFEEIRRELSHPQSHRGSIFRSKKPPHDEEEGDSDHSTQIDLEEYLRNQGGDSLPKKIGVSFRNLGVTGGGNGWILVPTFPNELAKLFGWGFLMRIRMMRAPLPEAKPIIQGFSGVVRPGEMLLVLGKPGSGASTLLRALTNQPRSFTAITGDVSYGGLPYELARGKYRGEILYNDEEDSHLPTLTVAQTLEFALKSKTPHGSLPGPSRAEFVSEMLNLFLTMFKMKHVSNNVVGNQYIFGVSGGERKRVSIMEALASRSAINAWDNSTRGLDSSTAVDYIRSLRILTNLSQSTTIVTLYQAGESIYREFDKVCLIYEGREIFFGRANEARGYFEGLGFEASPRVTTSDFLTAITDPKTRRIRAGMEGRVPETPATLETAFRSSKYWPEVQNELEAYDRELQEDSAKDTRNFKQAVKKEKSSLILPKSPYTSNFAFQTWYLTQREFQLQRQDVVAVRSKLINIIIMALVIGTGFYKIPKTSEGVFLIGGVLFFNIILVAWMQVFEAIVMVLGRGIMVKQVSFAFYRPSALVLARTIAEIPLLAIQSILYTSISYWLAGLQPNAGKFFIQLLFVFITTICITAFYRVLGAFSKDMNVSIRMVFISLSVLALFAGYMQPFQTMKSWVYKWIYWANPIHYALEALMVNQLHGLDLDCSPIHLIPGVLGASIKNQVCTLSGSRPQSSVIAGADYLKGFGYDHSHLWRNFGIIIAFTVAYLLVAMIGVEYMDFGAGGGSIKILTKKPEAVDGGLPTIEKGKRETEKPVEDMEITRKNSTVKGRGSIFTWRNVNYSIGEAQLLSNINGFAKPGRITALMGPSGAGKTTLLDNLGLRKRVGVTSGELLMDGKELMPDFGRSTAFVEQQDVHDEMSTVREAMRFSALLRQPPNVSKEEKYKFVDEIIKLLELETLADAIIGVPGFGLSVEERKRVTIAVELSSAPSELLFLDEPTSGLDANGALSIVRFLRKLATESGIAILCTIHQPSTVLFQEFDDLLLLARGGREVYFGPIGETGQTAVDFFDRNGAAGATSDMNPAEYILDAIRTPPSGPRTWPEIWEASPENAAALEEIDAIISARKDVPITREMRTLEYAMPLPAQIFAVTGRVWNNYWRDASYGVSKMVSGISTGLIGGVIFLNSGNTVIEMQSRSFAVFLIVILYPLITSAVQPKFLQLRTLYEVRERNSKIYSAPAWITAMAIVEIPYAILASIFFFLPWYYMIGLPSDSATAGYVFFLILLFNIWATYISMWTVAMCPDLNIVGMANTFLTLVTNTFSGILITYYALPKFYRAWLYWVNPLTWLVRGIMESIMHDLPVRCSPNELFSFTPPSGETCGQYAGDWLRTASGYIVDEKANDNCEYCVYKTGDEYLKTVNASYSTRWRDLGVFCVFTIVNVFLIYVLYFAFREYRWGRLFARLRGRKASN